MMSFFLKFKKKLLPQKPTNTFFDLFNQQAEQICIAMLELQALLTHFDRLDERMQIIVAAEKKGDMIMHTIMCKLHKNFNTPLNREEIHRLSSTLDDMLDLTEDISETIYLYDIQFMTEPARQLANICVQCADKVKLAVSLLSDMNHSTQLLDIAKELDVLEGDGDRVMRAAMAKLFREESDIKNIIKLKAIYEQLELITDKAEDVANVIQGIVLENAA